VRKERAHRGVQQTNINQQLFSSTNYSAVHVSLIEVCMLNSTFHGKNTTVYAVPEANKAKLFAQFLTN